LSAAASSAPGSARTNFRRDGSKTKSSRPAPQRGLGLERHLEREFLTGGDGGRRLQRDLEGRGLVARRGGGRGAFQDLHRRALQEERAAPMAASVPLGNSSKRSSGRARLRTMRGRDEQHDLGLVAVVEPVAEQAPDDGRSPTPGIWLVVRRSSSLMRPASTWVSPSFSRREVKALRVPTW